MDFDIGIESEYGSRVMDFITSGDISSSAISNEKFIEEGYENAALVTNFSEAGIATMHAIIMCICFLALKAILITVSHAMTAAFEGGKPGIRG